MATKKPSAAQLAARKKFSEIMKAGGFAKKRAAKKTVAKKRVAKKNPANVSYRSKPIEDLTAKQLRQWLGETAQFLTDKELNAFKSEAIILGYGEFEPAQLPSDVYFKLLRHAQGASRRNNPIVLISDTPKKATRKTVRKANPVKKTVVKKGSANFPFVVEVMRLVPGGHVWEMHAGLNTKAEASDLAHLIAENYPNVSVRVKSYK